MNRYCYLLFLAAVFFSCAAPPPPRVLIFSRTNGYRHQSIEAGKETLVKLCYDRGIQADTTENPVYLNEKNLKRYAAVVFLNTNGDVLNPAQEADFERYIQAGGGFMGVHSASATEYTWHWYGGLVGAYFKDHPAIQEAAMKPDNCGLEEVAHLDCQPWKWKEEWYNFRKYEPDLQVSLTINERDYKGGSCPPGVDSSAHPLSWRHTYDGGRAFYTALGHIPESYADPVFQQHLMGGLLYAIGQNKPLNYTRCRTQRLPDQTRFVKTVIADNLSEPMEIAELPDGKILLIERHGQLRLFNPATNQLNTVVKLPVYSEMGDGLIGLAVDPQWSENHWIYLYYSSLRDSMNQLSRFVFQGDTLDRGSEQVLLTIPVGRKDCFHAAGSMAFDAAGNLFLATGDNTSPFASDGYNPTDEQPGRKAFDAQRSSGNTNDLRGKILRIKPLPDGSYICPAGNLFTRQDVPIVNHVQPEPDSRQRPEIYVMGCRNPFRISYDQRRDFLFWGEIGPDAGKNSAERGPMGHDEINQARAAGFFGWPYFVADNQAYRDYDYATKTAGPAFDPKHPVNNSPNNSGLRELPPAQPAFIWYPYGKNRDFPIAGTGGRNAMAGPVFYADEYPEATRFPDYYDGKLIIYDWMRNWLMAVTMDSLGGFHHLEPFADSVKLSRPMDMFFSKSGTLWLIEYGTRWYSSNEDARFSRIDFVQGNRAPLARLKADIKAAAAPATITFDVGKTRDDDGGLLRCELDFGDGYSTVFTHTQARELKEPILRNNPVKAVKNQFPIPQHTYTAPGNYKAVLKVTDEFGMVSVDSVRLAIGNEKPRLEWRLAGRNRSFYQPGDTLFYQLLVSDREDGSLGRGIDGSSVNTSIDFFEKGVNPASLGKTAVQAAASDKYVLGKQLIESSDCKSCHAVDRQVNGPAFQAIAQRYRGNRDFAVPSIYRKIIYGSSGNWGTGVMIPHPQIREEEAIQMALWILSLGDPPKAVQTIPLSGSYVLTAEKAGVPAPGGAYVLRATYRDRGANAQAALENSSTLILRPFTLQAEQCDARSEGVGNYKPFGNDTTVLQELKHQAWFAFRQLDFTGIQSVVLRVGYGDKSNPYTGGRLEIHLGSVHGPLIGNAEFVSKNGPKMLFEEKEIRLNLPPENAVEGLPDVYFVFKNEQNQGQGVVAVDWVRMVKN